MVLYLLNKLDMIQIRYALLMMIIVTFALSSFDSLSIVNAAPIKRPVRIGVLTDSWGPTPLTQGLKDGLAALGYEENQDYFLGVRFTQGDRSALLAAARDLVKLGVNLINTETDPTTKAAQLATSTIPIVFGAASDPVGHGLVQSFARPGGNITGIADVSIDLGPKRLQLFQEIVPTLRRVLFPYDAVDALAVKEAETYRQAAQKLGIEFIGKPVHSPQEAQETLNQIQPDEIDGVLTPHCCSMNILGLVIEIIQPKQIPTMFESPFWVEQGAFAGYGPDYYESGKQSARIVHKIINGQQPAEIPVEINSKIEFAINLQVAKRMGIKIDSAVLYQADRVLR